jgi:V8-like Glu-specific endopeptidase
MIALTTVTKPEPVRSPLEALAAPELAPQRDETPGSAGKPDEKSRSLRLLVVKGRSAPLPRASTPHGALESIIGPTDDRVRILDTELAPWRMICALRMRGPSGAGAIGTGWFVGPKTIVTAGHCVYSTQFFGGWASTIEASPGRNGTEFPFGTLKSSRFSSVDRWVEHEDPDFDIGCIHLSEAPGEDVGWFAVGALPPAELEGFQVNVSGYPADRSMGAEQYHHKNRVLRVTERRVFYDVDTFGGQSGAPVWIHETEDAPPLAIGIHAYGIGGSTDDLQANSAPRIIPEVLAQIRSWVEADGGWPNAR